tara:strand:+ start:4776 stop:5075 length:300 start_codon:yes stop_codon:yes gene_type:complete
MLSNNSLVQQGTEVAFFGMTAVFVFLGLLVVVTMLMSALMRRIAPDEPVVPKIVPDAVSEILKSEIDQSGLIEVISAAVSQHRKKNNNKKEKRKKNRSD